MDQRYDITLGDYADNLCMLLVADYEVKNGRREHGYAMLALLQKHIEQSGELQSRHWLLPDIRSRLYN